MTARRSTLLRIIESRRLTLVSSTPELVDADLAGAATLATALMAEVPDSWPPELFEVTTMRSIAEQLRDPTEQGWAVWYLLSRPVGAERDHGPRVIGICGFRGRPDASGRVEISYSVLPEYRIQGYATEAVSRLVVWAFSHQNVSEVIAETMPHMTKSIRVLEKNGFAPAGQGSEQGVVRYAVTRVDRR